MDEQKPTISENQSDIQWSDTPAEPALEIGMDEQAVAAAGLTDPADLELEKIIQETKAGVWGQDDNEPPTPTTENAFKDEEFRSTFGEGESLNQVFSEDTPAPEEPTPTPMPTPPEKSEPDPLEKGRPKRKQGYGLFGLPHLAATVIWLLIIIAIGVSVARMVWLCAADVLALGRTPTTVSVTIDKGDTIDDIATKLKDAGLINYPELFKLYANFTNAEKKIQPGVYTINPPDAEEQDIVYDYMALVDLMSPHRVGQVVVSGLRIPEGYTCAQIFQLLEEKKVCTRADLEEYIAGINPEDENAPSSLKEYWFLDGVQWGDKYSLEGYLFPNTYDFYENDDPQRVVEKMLDSFNANFNDVMKQKLEALDGYTIREVIIIASMIEKETSNDLESFTVSSVIYNRLHNSSEYPYLNIDATIVYALGGKTDLTAEDLLIDHPYNTYNNKGLPPGPISSPSQNSIGAALDPEDTGYYFYALDPSTGEHHFSKTYRDHLDFLNSLGGNR